MLNSRNIFLNIDITLHYITLSSRDRVHCARLVVGQLSEVVPFLLLEQRCGMACQAMLRRPRRCR